MNYWIGQGFGILATITELILPQFKKKQQMLVANIFVNLFYGLNLVFLSRIGSGIFLFAVAICQGILNLVRTLKDQPSQKWEYPVFCCLYVGLGLYGLFTSPDFVPAINGRNLLELLPIVGAVLSMIFISIRDVTKARKFLLSCNLTWMTYHAIIGSTSVFAATCSAVSCTIAMIRNKRANKAQGESK